MNIIYIYYRKIYYFTQYIVPQKQILWSVTALTRHVWTGMNQPVVLPPEGQRYDATLCRLPHVIPSNRRVKHYGLSLRRQIPLPTLNERATGPFRRRAHRVMKMFGDCAMDFCFHTLVIRYLFLIRLLIKSGWFIIVSVSFLWEYE